MWIGFVQVVIVPLSGCRGHGGEPSKSVTGKEFFDQLKEYERFRTDRSSSSYTVRSLMRCVSAVLRRVYRFNEDVPLMSAFTYICLFTWQFSPALSYEIADNSAARNIESYKDEDATCPAQVLNMSGGFSMPHIELQVIFIAAVYHLKSMYEGRTAPDKPDVDGQIAPEFCLVSLSCQIVTLPTN